MKWARDGGAWGNHSRQNKQHVQNGGQGSSEKREEWREVLGTDRQGLGREYVLHSVAAGSH